VSWPHQLLLGLAMFLVALVATCTLLPFQWALPEHSALPSVGPEAAPTPSPEPSASPTPAPSPTLARTPRPTTTPAPAARHSISGTASYCAPTPTRCQGWGGTARLGAVPTFHFGDRRYLARACERLADAGTRCVTVLVVSYCACRDKVIDLSPDAFRQLAPLSRGIVPVRVTW
jgi:hypothetical protein